MSQEQINPGDPELFLENARDTVRRYRNHPSNRGVVRAQ